MKNLMPLVVAAPALMAVGGASAEEGGMMNGRYGDMWGEGWMGGYGGFWGPALLVVAVALVALMVMRRRK